MKPRNLKKRHIKSTLGKNQVDNVIQKMIDEDREIAHIT